MESTYLNYDCVMIVIIFLKDTLTRYFLYMQGIVLPCNFFNTATSIFSTCFGCCADSTFSATFSRVSKSNASQISPNPPPPIFLNCIGKKKKNHTQKQIRKGGEERKQNINPSSNCLPNGKPCCTRFQINIIVPFTK